MYQNTYPNPKFRYTGYRSKLIKYVFEDGSRASYDFGENLSTFQWGMQAGVSWSAYKHLVVNANLVWGCNDIFESSFKTISFDLYPVYLNFGFGPMLSNGIPLHYGAALLDPEGNVNEDANVKSFYLGTETLLPILETVKPLFAF